jgi:3-hydroxy-9,10-secoandrosta-1,3,5(10)-triene-9,17-dione monooxygenase
MSETFVSDDFSLSVQDIAGGATPGSDIHPNPLFKLPVFALFPYVLSGCALGNAQACLDDFIEQTGKRASRYNSAKLAELQSLQIKISAAGAKVSAARRIMRAVCIDATTAAQISQFPDMLAKTRMRRDGAFAVNLCTEAVDMLFRASGATGLFTSNHIQRQFRDAHAINAHITFNFDATGSNNGRVELGFENENLTL